MRNIKNMVLFFLVMTSFSTSGMGDLDTLDLFSGCLIACTGDFANIDTCAYKTGPDTSICFGILVKRNPIKLCQEFGTKK